MSNVTIASSLNNCKFIHHQYPLIPCPECGKILPPDIEITIENLKGSKLQCHECNSSLDWWIILLNAVKQLSPLKALAPIGARSTIFSITLYPLTPILIKLTDYGVPSDSKLLAISYTPQGESLFPTQSWGYIAHRQLIPHEFTIYPVSRHAEPKETEVGVWVVWVPHTADDEAWQRLVQGFEFYNTDQYDSAIINTNIAVESKLGRLLFTFMHSVSHISKERIENFLQDGATYGHQLNVILPLITYFKGFPKLQDEFRGLLNRLKKTRDKLVHEGRLEKVLQKDETAEMISAALFGFRYLELLEKELTGIS